MAKDFSLHELFHSLEEWLLLLIALVVLLLYDANVIQIDKLTAE